MDETQDDMNKSCEEKGYHGKLGIRDGKWICRDCKETDFCSLCGTKAKTYVNDLYDMVGEQICPECLKEEKPISDYLEKNRVEYNSRDYVVSLLDREKKDIETKAKIESLENVLIEILGCDSDKYSSPEEAIDAIFALAFNALPEEKRPKPTPNIIVSQIGLGRALGN